MRLRRVDRIDAPQSPFPLRLYLVAVSSDGTEVIRYYLNAEMTGFNQEITLNGTFKLETGL